MVDRAGIVRDLSIGNENLAKDADIPSWIGRRWIDTVTAESRPKIDLLLKDAAVASKPPIQWRQVNHPTGAGRADLPVRYAAIPVRQNGQVIVIGRELRSMSLIQQKLVESQQAMEREFARVRHAETRYRLLFQVSNEAILIVDASTLRVVEVNPVARRLIGSSAKQITGKAFIDFIEPASQGNVQRMVDVLRLSGKADDVAAKLATTGDAVAISGSLFRQETSSQLLVRLVPVGGRPMRESIGPETRLRTLVEKLPDAFVVTNADGHIQIGNAAFLDLTQLVAPDQLKGQAIERWIGRSPTEVRLLLDKLAEVGSVRKFSTIVRGELGASEEIEISAVAAEEAGETSIGFAIRWSGQPGGSDAWPRRDLPGSVQHLTGLVGQVPLKNLVRETADIIERMCIEAALQIVGDNRASAAEMLGLSRQSLYMKLRRYGIGDIRSE